MKRHARDFRNQNIRVDPKVDLQHGEWYRSPLSSKDHLLSRRTEEWKEGLSWCGFSLGYVKDWDNDEFGGLWYSSRTTNKCSECTSREKGSKLDG